jgi:hypothetical protein
MQIEQKHYYLREQKQKYFGFFTCLDLLFLLILPAPHGIGIGLSLRMFKRIRKHDETFAREVRPSVARMRMTLMGLPSVLLICVFSFLGLSDYVVVRVVNRRTCALAQSVVAAPKKNCHYVGPCGRSIACISSRLAHSKPKYTRRRKEDVVEYARSRYCANICNSYGSDAGRTRAA